MRAVAKYSYPSGKDGFTLVEVMVSMFLMATVFTAAFGSYFLGMRIIEDARDQVRASQIIQTELERLRTTNWEQLEALPPIALVPIDKDFASNTGKQYLALRLIENITGYPQKSVVVGVYWRNSRGFYTRQIFNTVFTQNGLNDYYYRDI